MKTTSGNRMSAVVTIALCWLSCPAFGQLHRETEAPGIHGAAVFGARPNHPFLYKVPATGAGPIRFSATGLPRGLELDAQTGIITGKVASAGTSEVVLRARNSLGTTQRKFRIVIGDQLALTPPMGWSSWDFLQTEVTDREIRAQADAMVRSGLVNHGYSYINIDDGWSVNRAVRAPEGLLPRDAAGNIEPNHHFPDMKALTTYLHSQGMRAGLYTSPSARTCGKFEGSLGHEQQDADQFASWGFDLLKYDWCSYPAKDHSVQEMQKPYRLMGSILASENRDILFSLCQYGRGDVWNWGREVGGQTWRTTGDLAWGPRGMYTSWENIAADFSAPFVQADQTKSIGPGGWNDLDDLLIGHIAYIPFNEHPPNVHIDRRMPPPLTPDEQYLQMSFWSLLSAPLLIGGDLTTLDDFSLSLLTNDEVIAVDQDPLGRPAVLVFQDGKHSVWVKDLEDGSKAVGLFNFGEGEEVVGAKWTEMGMSGQQQFRDLWRGKDLGSFNGEFHALVAPHGVVLVKTSPNVR